MTIAKEAITRKEAQISQKTPISAPKDLLLVGALVAASAASFGLGAVAFTHPSALQATPSGQEAAVYQTLGEGSTTPANTSSKSGSKAKAPKPVVGHASGTYVASKNGTKIYLPTCSGAKRIKPENQIWFLSKEEAAASGFTPSSTCKGM